MTTTLQLAKSLWDSQPTEEEKRQHYLSYLNHYTDCTAEQLDQAGRMDLPQLNHFLRYSGEFNRIP